jgi:protein involved in polysaccharide export with SLBB domain
MFDRSKFGGEYFSRPAVHALGILLLVSATVFGQARSPLELYSPPDATGSRTQNQLDVEDRLEQQREMVRQSVIGAALEGAVDPLVYRVGPNDLFNISIGGTQPIQSLVPVSSDGYLVVTGVDRVMVAGKTLADAQADIERLLRANFANVPVNVALSQPRQFFVHVTGAVSQPGRYLALPVSRVSDVVEQATYSVDGTPPPTNATYRPALRNVEIRHSDGSNDVVDLVAYYRGGFLDQNPYLMDGDVVEVPAFRPTQRAIFIDGEIPFPGMYDYREDDTLLDLLRLGTGGQDFSRIDRVRVTRRNPGGRISTQEYRMADLTAPGSEDIHLEPLDAVHVPHPVELTGAATVEGAVRFPGTYAIEQNVTTLKELVEMAGGFRDDALVSAATLVQDDPTDELIVPVDLNLPRPQFHLLTDTSAVQQDIRLSSLDFFGRNHLAIELLEQNRISVDVEAALEEGADPVFLPDAARLIVPRDEKVVRVLGQVVRPGRITFMGPVDATTYIRAAGGLGPRAGKSFLLKAGTGQWLRANDGEIESGDVLFVSRKGDLPSNQELARLMLQRRDVRLRTFQVAFTAVSALTAIITTSLFIRREFRD